MPVNPYAIGNTVEEYRIEELLGEGSFANVFKVFSEDREKHYVLKVIMPQDSNKRPQKPFKIELDALDEIRKLGTHTHIVGLEKWGRLHETKDPYVLLEFIDGETVTARVKRSQTLPRVDVVEIQQIILQLLDALQFMHRRVIHRDIKPNNLMLSPSRGVVVIDFNVSKVMLPGESKTIVGTPPYIPPEILLEKGNWTPASDLYAVGIFLYYLLTGKEDPFPNHGARLLRETKPANPKDRIPTLPDSIVRTMMKAIAYDPTERYQDAEEMKKDVENWFPANIEELIQRVQTLRNRIVQGLQIELADGDRATLEDALKDLEQILVAPATYDPEHDLLDDIEAITEEILEPQGDDIILDGDRFPHEKYDPEPPENEPEPKLEEEPVVDKIRGKLIQIRIPRDAGEFDVARQALKALQQETGDDAESLKLLEKEEAEIQTAQNLAFGKLIESARNYIAQKLFDEAEKEIEEARSLDPQSSELKTLVRDINKGRNAFLDSLEKSVCEKLAEVTDSSLEEKELEELLGGVSLLIDEYEKKGTHQNAASKVQEWRKQLNQIQKNLEAVKVQQARVQCERLWGEGGVPNALEALNLVYALQENLKEPKHPTVLKLREEAEEKYKMFLKEAGVLLTAAITGRFQELIEEYEKKRDEGIKYVPLFTPERDKDGKLTIKSEEEAQSELLESARLEETWEVTKAIPELQSIARDYARQKAEEKKTEAEKYLVESPRRTKEILEEALGLYLLATEDREKIKQFLQNAVAPAVQRREEAEKLRDGAEQLGPLEGWQQLQEAINHDPHVPGIAEVRARLRPRFQQNVKQELDRLRRNIKGVPRAYLGQEKHQKRYENAIARAAELASASGQDDALASLTAQLETFITAAKNDIQEYAYVSQEMASMRQYMEQRNYRLANEAFARIEQKLGKEALNTYQELRDIQAKLETRGNVDALIARIETDLNAPEERLVKQIEALEDALSAHPDHLKIPPLLRRARSRINYERGRVFYDQRQYKEARPLLRAVEGEDRDEARKLLKELDAAEHEKDKLESTLRQARRNREMRMWRIAYNSLTPWKERRLPEELEDDFKREFEDTREQWEEYARNELERLSRQEPLNERLIREQLEALAELGSTELDRWQKDGLARCYEQTAREKARRGRLQESIAAWQEAMRLDPGNETYEEELIKAEKSQVAQQIAAAPADLEQAERLYKHLRVRYPEDIDIGLKLANVYLKQEKYAETEYELNWVDTTIRQLGLHADPEMVQDKERLKRALEHEQDIHRRQRTIEPMLHPTREQDDYQTAKEKYEALKTQYPDASRLTPWWDSVVHQLALALEKQSADLLNANEPLWKAAAPVLKILVLQPQNGYARRLISQLAHQVLTLATRIDQMLADTIGRYDVEPERALAQQITETGDLLEEVGAYIFALRHHTGQINDGQERQNELQQYRVRLNQRLRDLKSLQSLLQQGYNQLERGKTSGNWTAVDRIQAQIVQGEFGGHHTVSLFLNELNRAKQIRQQLQQKVTELKQALASEAFEQVLQSVADLQEVDPDDDYTVYGNTAFATNLRSRPIAFSELTGVVSRHLSDLKKLNDWLSPVLKVAVWWPPFFPDDIPTDGNLAGLNGLLQQWLAQTVPPQDGSEAINIWRETTRYALPAIRRYKAEGKFKEAVELCTDILGEDGRIQVQSSAFVGRYTLNHIYNHLSRPPVLESPDVQSTHSGLAPQSAEAFRERLFSWLTQARQEQANMANEEIKFRNLLKDLRNKVNQFSTAWPWEKGRIRAEGIVVFNQAKQICPNYRGLDSLRSLLDG